MIIWKQGAFTIDMKSNVFTLLFRNEFRSKYVADKVDADTEKIAIESLINDYKRTANSLTIEGDL